jgi:hypothetical protein
LRNSKFKKTQSLHLKVFFLTFLGLFSYTLLFQFKYIDGEAIHLNQSNNSDSEVFEKEINHFLSVFDIILLIWVTALIAEEIRQVF